MCRDEVEDTFRIRASLWSSGTTCSDGMGKRKGRGVALWSPNKTVGLAENLSIAGAACEGYVGKGESVQNTELLYCPVRLFLC